MLDPKEVQLPGQSELCCVVLKDSVRSVATSSFLNGWSTCLNLQSYPILSRAETRRKINGDSTCKQSLLRELFNVVSVVEEAVRCRRDRLFVPHPSVNQPRRSHAALSRASLSCTAIPYRCGHSRPVNRVSLILYTALPSSWYSTQDGAISNPHPASRSDDAANRRVRLHPIPPHRPIDSTR